jgi:flagellar motility protein MotE (MotC chaperone)
MDPINADPLIGYFVSVTLMILTLTSIARFFGLGKDIKSAVRIDPEQIKDWTREQSLECSFQHRELKEGLAQLRDQGTLRTQILQSILGNSRDVNSVLKQLSKDHEAFYKRLEDSGKSLDQIRQAQLVDIRVQDDLEQLGKRLEEGNKAILKYVTEKQ